MSLSAELNVGQFTAVRRTGQWLRVLGLPALLMALLYVVAGFYYETNDDVVIKSILQGQAADLSASSLLIYLPGWSGLLISLYAWAPGFAWYDWLMVLATYGALAATFYALESILAQPHQSGFRVAAVEVLYFAVTYPLHLMQFNFTRPAILLGAAAVALLIVATGQGRPRVGLWITAGLLFIAGWGIRPVGAEVGAILVAPLLLLMLPRKAAVLAGLYVAGLTGILLLANAARQSPDDKAYIDIQARRATILDYERAKVQPQTPTDSVAAGMLQWGAAPYDTGLINADFFQRCIRPATTAEMKQSWLTTLGLIVRDVRQWALGALALAFLGGLLVWWRRSQGALKPRTWQLIGYALYQVFFWAIYVGVGLWFHQVPRVSQPLLSVYVLSNLLLVSGVLGVDVCSVPSGRGAALFRWAFLAIVGGCALLSVERGWRIYLTESGQEARHAAYLEALHAQSAHTTIVEAGFNEMTTNLRLFKDYHLRDYPKFITLLNWHKFDPGQARLLRALTGQAAPGAALLALGQKPQTQVTWLLRPDYVPATTRYLNLTRSAGQRLRFVPVPSRLPADQGPQQYMLVAGE